MSEDEMDKLMTSVMLWLISFGFQSAVVLWAVSRLWPNDLWIAGGLMFCVGLLLAIGKLGIFDDR